MCCQYTAPDQSPNANGVLVVVIQVTVTDKLGASAEAIEGVYTDDVRKIEIYAIHFLEGEVRDIHRIRFVKKGTAFEEGGYLWHDEYMQWLNEQEWD